MTGGIKYWLQGEAVQNFGDYLSEYFLHHLFFPEPKHDRTIRLIGSCIDDWFIDPLESGAMRPIFWGCGLRKPDGLSTDRFADADFLAVRGPLTRSALRLGRATPMGDPGLLLPALHRAAGQSGQSGQSILVPHFHELRSDAELLALTGCSAVLRPNIAADLTSVNEFVDQIVAADFVLSGSLHAAVMAAAYDRPFAFWDSGDIDLPFKWQDFAASVSMPCVFQGDLSAATDHYAAAIVPALCIPVLWPLLVAAPLPVRPDAFAGVVKCDVARHGMAALNVAVSSRASNDLHDRLLAIARTAADGTRSSKELAMKAQRESALRDRVADLSARETRLAETLAEREALEDQRQQRDAARLDHLGLQLAETMAREAVALAETRALEQQSAAEKLIRETKAQEVERLRADAVALAENIARLSTREAWLAAEEARLHRAVQDRDVALAAARTDVQAHALVIRHMRHSVAWRVGAPMRAIVRRFPHAGRRLRRLVWAACAIVSGRFPEHRRRRRQSGEQEAVLRTSSLFDAAHYHATYPDVAAQDAAAHYVRIGAALAYEPNPLFDGAWYRATYPDCSQSGMTPFVHYILVGAALGNDPHPLFESAWYAARNGVTIADALAHYVRTGASDGAAPNRLFDPAGYVSHYPDAQESGLPPLQHFIHQGAARRYHPHALFDTGWYCATYPDAAASTINPLAHYLRVGEALGHRCSSLQERFADYDLSAAPAFTERLDPEVSIVVPVYGGYFDTLRCLHALAATSAGTVGFEVIVVDDNPANPTAPLLRGIAGLRLAENQENLGFLRTCNRSATMARGWNIVFLNSDTLVWPGWLEPLVHLVRQDPRVGLVGCKLLNADGTVQEAGGIIFRSGWGYSFGAGDAADRPEYNYLREVDVVVGAAFLVRRDLFDMLGGFDDRYAPAFYEEFDLAFKARAAGYRVMYQPRSAVTHLGSNSYGPEKRDYHSKLNHDKFRRKWAAALDAQPEDYGDFFLARQRSMTLATILMIDDKVPEYDRHAGALTVYQYARLLVRLGFRVIFGPADGIAREPYTAALQAMGIEVLYSPVTLEDWLQAHGRHLTVVWTARPYVTVGLLDTIRQTTNARILYYLHDLHYLREMRRYLLDGSRAALEESNRVRKLELKIFHEADCLMTPSTEEAAIIRKEVPDADIRVIPPYLYPAAFGGVRREDDSTALTEIVFVGGFKHAPNVDAALWLVQDIMPLVWREMPMVRLLLVGDSPDAAVRALACERVEVTGYVPDLAPYFSRARASISPLRYGAGVKGKIVSSLQAAVPVITTQVGNEGIGLVDGTEALLGETPAELAAQMLRLMRDPALCARLSQAGRAVVQHRFSESHARAVIMDLMHIDHCNVCGKTSLGKLNYADEQHGNWSEQFACVGCYALNRTQVLADVILQPLQSKGVNSLKEAVPYLSRLRTHEFSIVGPIVEQLRECLLFTCSEYFDDETDAVANVHGAPCQDLQALTFRDGEFDLLISQDVLEHVGDAAVAFSEIYRVLKPGGRHVFTVPYSRDRDETLVRARIVQGGVEHVLPPVYHGDPVRPGGALAFREFGRDLHSLLEGIGFDVVLHETVSPGKPGGYVAVFETIRC